MTTWTPSGCSTTRPAPPPTACTWMTEADRTKSQPSPRDRGVLVQGGQPPLLPGGEERELYSDTLHDLHRYWRKCASKSGWPSCCLSTSASDGTAARSRCTSRCRPLWAYRSSCRSSWSPCSRPMRCRHRRRRCSPTTCTARWGAGRYLSRWLAGQLLDSVVLRALSCMGVPRVEVVAVEVVRVPCAPPLLTHGLGDGVHLELGTPLCPVRAASPAGAPGCSRSVVPPPVLGGRRRSVTGRAEVSR